MAAYLCGVPQEHCEGGFRITSKSLGGKKGCRVHSSSSEAFRCYARYLVRVLGYQRIGPREYRPPDGGPVLVLTKKCRFGGRLRPGKSGEKGKYRGDRVMPHKHPSGMIYST